MKKINLSLIFLIIFIIITGCDNNKSIDIKTKKIVVILSGSIDDMSWNKANIEGIEACNREKNIEIEYLQNVKEKDYERVFVEYALKGYDLIIGAGSQFNDSVEMVAPNYKNSFFCVINGSILDMENVLSLQINENEAAYIASTIAGKETDTGVFAVIGGYPNHSMKDMLDVYEENAVKIAKERGLSEAHSLRAYTNSWDNVGLGKKISERMLEEDVDIVFVYANKVCLGALEAIKDQKARMIGFVTDQSALNQEKVIASVVFDFQKLYTWILEEYAKSTLEKRRLYCIGMNQNLFYVADTDRITNDTNLDIERILEDLKKGKIQLGEE